MLSENVYNSSHLEHSDYFALRSTLTITASIEGVVVVQR